VAIRKSPPSDEGRIRDERFRIHLYIWINVAGTTSYFFNVDHREHIERLCGYLGIDPASIVR